MSEKFVIERLECIFDRLYINLAGISDVSDEIGELSEENGIPIDTRFLEVTASKCESYTSLVREDVKKLRGKTIALCTENEQLRSEVTVATSVIYDLLNFIHGFSGLPQMNRELEETAMRIVKVRGGNDG